MTQIIKTQADKERIAWVQRLYRRTAAALNIRKFTIHVDMIATEKGDHYAIEMDNRTLKLSDHVPTKEMNANPYRWIAAHFGKMITVSIESVARAEAKVLAHSEKAPTLEPSSIHTQKH